MSTGVNELYKKLSYYKVHHFVFWALYVWFWFFLLSARQGWQDALTNALITISVHAIISYFNIYVLFTKLLKRKEYFTYVLSLILTVLLGCFMLAITYYNLETISEQSKVTIWAWEFFRTNAISISYTLAITMSLKMVKQWYERERMTQDLEKITMETELKYLKSQINPHFLFNSLNSLYALTLVKSDKAPELVLKLSEILRYILYEAREKFVSLDKEINYLRSYLELEKIRYGDRLDVDFEIIGDTTKRKIAPMLFLTFLENSFKHGISNSTSDGYVKIVMEIKSNSLAFSISNSKPSKQSEKTFKGGIGLENTKKRLNILYPDKFKLETQDSENNYRVNLNLQLNKTA
jgi:two-component system, LytTR family, sensor kinase